MSESRYQADVVIVGAGLAGIVTAIELLEEDKRVLLIDRDKKENFGGLAKESFGGIFFVDTPLQRRAGFKDSIDLALQDWLSFAEFPEDAKWPRLWAEQYVNQCTEEVYDWLKRLGIRFFPVVHWVERGWDKPGNSVPRFHMVWGTGQGLIKTLVSRLLKHRNADKLTMLFRHRVIDITADAGKISGVNGVDETNDEPFEVSSDYLVVATGGISGSIEKVKSNWYKPWGKPPEVILNGSHEYAIGEMHDVVKAKANAHVTNLEKMWPYAAGVRHHRSVRPDHGLSIIPPKSALWFNYKGDRFNPPLVSGFDTRYLVEQICKQEEKYSWQILNMKIAVKEFAVSGSEHNKAIRNKNILQFLSTIFFGDRRLVKEFLNENKDFIIADSIEELVSKMNNLVGKEIINAGHVAAQIDAYDSDISGNRSDEQVKRIAQIRLNRGDRLRTCKFQKVNDPKALPLIAIREFILSRKSLGGIETDLESRVLNDDGPVAGLYCAGEAAGFGGGGMHGLRSLEGTFLGGCILTGRLAARSILKG